MALNTKQQQAFELIAKGKNVFISGPGGVGKSFLINHIRDHFSGSTVFLAPTGIAALNIGGATIHSTFKFPLRILDKVTQKNVSDKTAQIFSSDGPVKRIVVDEISMNRADTFEAMDTNLRKIRNNNRPFGGLQVIGVGDFFQLPPVVGRNESQHFYNVYDSMYCFSTEAWARAEFEYIELDEVVRQNDQIFIGHLQAIRQKKSTFNESLNYINSKCLYNHSVMENDPTFLCATNKAAEVVNQSNYEELEGEERVFNAKIEGTVEAHPAPKYLALKYGTKVIITANSPADGYMNGHVGYVIGFVGNDAIRVILEHNEEEVLIKRNVWEQIDYKVEGGSLKTEPIGKFTQFPIKLGYAITIHKSQGQTMNNVVIDMGRGAFAHGQTYVALSRIRTIEGLAIFSPIRAEDIIVDREVIEFYKRGCRGRSILDI